jgi:head-tail adaptor
MADVLLRYDDLVYLRAEGEKSLPDTVNIHRRTLDSDKQGGFTESWPMVYENVPARLTFASASESITTGREDVGIQFALTVAYDQSVEQSDRISHGSNTFEVVSVTGPRSWDTVKRCQIRQV